LRSVEFSPDSKMVASGGDDKNHSPLGQCLRPGAAPDFWAPGRSSFVCFSPTARPLPQEVVIERRVYGTKAPERNKPFCRDTSKKLCAFASLLTAKRWPRKQGQDHPAMGWPPWRESRHIKGRYQGVVSLSYSPNGKNPRVGRGEINLVGYSHKEEDFSRKSAIRK